tara:strand:- start:13055 stop:13435 length:381 start_codon:yes stop_codon:yes gene_type:complete
MTANSNSEVQNGRSLDLIKWAFVAVLTSVAIAVNEVFDDVWVLYRSIGVAIALIFAAVIALQTDKGKQFVAFSKESEKEVRKVIWPSRQEATNTTLIVFAVTALFGVILWGLDSLLVTIVNLILGI